MQSSCTNLAILIINLCVWCKIEFGNECGPEHNLEWIMQLIVLNMDAIVNEMWF
jgi:hypothetical protein